MGAQRSVKTVEKALDTIAALSIQVYASAPLLCTFAGAILLRCIIATCSYSGEGQWPHYGDFEAQRHWMEITSALPITQWYFFSQKYWPLDYPPLTAYHSKLLGHIGKLFNEDWFSLYSSRGFESLGLKVFMRASVILSECIIYMPSIAVLCLWPADIPGRKLDKKKSVDALAALLLQPAILLVDHGHFQYNAVMLGFAMAAIVCLQHERNLLACLFFVAALGFKQMALFYAPAIAAYLAGGCLFPHLRVQKLIAIAATTMLAVGLLYAPLLVSTAYEASLPSDGLLDPSPRALVVIVPQHLRPYCAQILKSLSRIFPLSRGIIEDKVANLWCAINHSGFYKLTEQHTDIELAQAASILTLVAILPPCIVTFFRPKKQVILPAVTACAWGFFLCGYHVHEKSVLLPLIPMTAMLAHTDGEAPSTRAWVGFANITGMWTLFHLAIKDDLKLAYFWVVVVWAAIFAEPLLLEPYRSSCKNGPSRATRWLHLIYYSGIAIWHILEFVVPPPAGKPDLWIVVAMILGCGAFCTCYMWCLWRTFCSSGLEKEIKAACRFLFTSHMLGQRLIKLSIWAASELMGYRLLLDGTEWPRWHDCKHTDLTASQYV